MDVALQEPDLAADVINYGYLATDAEALKKINAPILGLFGGQDHGITPDDVPKFEHALKGPGKKIEVKIYDDAGHAFENPNNKEGYRPADAADAWRLTVGFLSLNVEKEGAEPHHQKACRTRIWAGRVSYTLYKLCRNQL